MDIFAVFSIPFLLILGGTYPTARWTAKRELLLFFFKKLYQNEFLISDSARAKIAVRRKKSGMTYRTEKVGYINKLFLGP